MQKGRGAVSRSVVPPRLVSNDTHFARINGRGTALSGGSRPRLLWGNAKTPVRAAAQGGYLMRRLLPALHRVAGSLIHRIAREKPLIALREG